MNTTITEIFTDCRSWRPASGGTSVRSSLTSRPSAPRWDWEVHLQIFVLTLYIVQVVGVCTDSHVTVRTMLMNSAELKVPHSYRGVGAYIV